MLYSFRKGVAHTTFNQRARDLREDMEMTQEELAVAIGVGRETVNRYENDKFDMKFTYAIVLAKLYNVSLDYIAGFADEPMPLPKK